MNAFSEWASVRSLFDLDPREANLSLFFVSPHPRPVRRAIAEYAKRLDADGLQTVERAMFNFNDPESNLATRACNAIGRYLGTSGGDIALTGSTTAGLGLFYQSLALRPGDEILTTEHEHYSHHEAIRLAANRSGASWRKIALYDSFDSISTAEIVLRVERAIRPATRFLGITWVCSGNGVKLPVRAISDAVSRVNRDRDAADRVRLVVDGVHALGVEDPNIAALGCDAFIAGMHKWMFGPRGTGFVWARSELWEKMLQLFPSFTAFELFDAWLSGRPPATPPRAAWFSPGGFHSFEHYWATPAAIELHESIGPARITARVRALATQLKEGLSRMPHVKLYTPRSIDLSSGIVCFDVAGLTAKQLVERLRSTMIIGSMTPYAISYGRLAPSFPNDEAEVERALRAIHALT